MLKRRPEPVTGRLSVRGQRGSWVCPDLITRPSSGDNVEEAFLRTAQKIYQHIQDGSLDLDAAESGVQAKQAGGPGGLPCRPSRGVCWCGVAAVRDPVIVAVPLAVALDKVSAKSGGCC